MRKLLILFISVLICSNLSSHTSGDYLFRLLDTKSGLPDNQVRNMAMLPDGMMCIITSSMLNLYDGLSCQSYAWNPIEIPYTEYSALTEIYYDRIDNILWCTSRDKIWVFNLNSRTFEYDITVRLEAFGLKNVKANGLFLDEKCNMWLISKDNEIWHCDREKNTIERIEMLEGMKSPLLLRQDKERIWMLSLDGMLAEYDTGIRNFRSVVKNVTGTATTGSSRMEMSITSKGELWMMFDRHLIRYNPENGNLTHTENLLLDKRNLLTSIALDMDDNLWLGTARSGVGIIDNGTMKIHKLPYLEQTDGNRIYHHTDISKIYADVRGGIWIATLSEGLLYWSKDIIHLHTMNSESLKHGKMDDESVKCMVEDTDGTILAGTIKGLYRYDPVQDRITVPYESLKNELCISLYRDSRDRIWLGTFYNGAYCIDKGRIRHYSWPDKSTVDVSYLASTPNYNCVRSFYEDGDGTFWISVYGGIGIFDTATGEIRLLRDSHPELKRFMMVRDICDHRDGKLLVSGDNGRFLYSPSEDKVYTDSTSTKCHKQSNQAIVDGRGLLWIATDDGLTASELNSGQSYEINNFGGMQHGTVMSIATDDLGNIWASTFNHISRIKPVKKDGKYTFAVSSYGNDDGVYAGAFFQKSVLKHSSGNIYFGGAHGIAAVVPSKTYQANHNNPPIISSLSIAGKRLEVGEEFNGRVILPTELDKAGKISLRHDESFISFSFSNCNYANPTHTSYKYMLENFDREWTAAQFNDLGKATYTYLEPGNYCFKVIAANNDTDWSTAAKIDFVIRPPFYKSTPAYILYALFAITIAVFSCLYAYKRARMNLRDRREREAQRQKEELDQMKFRFFTNISHELRTPLTLILLPLESMMRDNSDSKLMPQMKTMYQNANQLLSLVNHILDFRKLETGGEKLHLIKGNICEFVENIVLLFREAMNEKHIKVEIENSVKNPVITFDNSMMKKILNNLLSNALKFTPEGGHIHVSLSQDTASEGEILTISVADSGIGIPEKDLDSIFDRFYRSENSSMSTGSGIGLNLVRQYARMHGGDVSVESELNKGTVFRVSIPMWLKADEEIAEENAAVAERVDGTDEKEDRQTIMLVDDNAEFRTYLASELSRHYHVIQASDGKECLKLLEKQEPDVIVSDVMMPKIDGLELTKRIKSSIDTSHIPVILLSARMSEDVRLEGYETGADAYLTKPFKMDMLEARIHNLLEERQRRISSFASNREINPSEITITTIDEKLMVRIMDCIEKNMDNSEYSVEKLSADVGMHRMNLYRKLQSLSGMTPSEFMRTMRLKRAAQILKSDPNLTVLEVSDMVGFNSSKYFAKYFKEMFGMTPSQYQKE